MGVDKVKINPQIILCQSKSLREPPPAEFLLLCMLGKVYYYYYCYLNLEAFYLGM
jgi:hypothetical protein